MACCPFGQYIEDLPAMAVGTHTIIVAKRAAASVLDCYITVFISLRSIQLSARSKAKAEFTHAICANVTGTIYTIFVTGIGSLKQSI